MSERPEIRYRPCRCRLLHRTVWAILTKQAQKNWRIVNCLDKDRRCFQKHCVFTQDGGHWPFDSVEPHCMK